MRYLDPKNDLTFKKVFGGHPHLLKSLLNAMLPLQPGGEIEYLEYLPADMVPVVPELKYSIVDVRCYDKMGRHFIVEMQMLWTDSFKSRIQFNASKAYVQQLGKGKVYEELQPVYALSFVNEVFEKDVETFYHHYSLVHSIHPEKKLDGLQFVFVELPKFQAKSVAEKKMQVLWLRFLTEIDENINQAPPEMLENAELSEALEYVEESAFTRQELESYDKYWDSISSQRTLLNESITKAKAEGKVEGKAEGISEEKAMTVLTAFENGISIDQIAAIVRIGREEVAEILLAFGKTL